MIICGFFTSIKKTTFQKIPVRKIINSKISASNIGKNYEVRSTPKNPPLQSGFLRFSHSLRVGKRGGTIGK